MKAVVIMLILIILFLLCFFLRPSKGKAGEKIKVPRRLTILSFRYTVYS